MNNIALLQLRVPVKNALKHIIRLCRTPEDHGTRVGTCSMGSISAPRPSFPIRLREAVFTEDKFVSRNPYDMRLCREDFVCTERIPGDETTNLCYKDDGAPLYTMKCGSRIPDCLYGIASHYQALPTRRSGRSSRCTGGSYFASIPHLHDWIMKTMQTHR